MIGNMFDAAIELAVVLFGYKVLHQTRTVTAWDIAVGILPDGGNSSLSVIFRNIASSLSRFNMGLSLSVTRHYTSLQRGSTAPIVRPSGLEGERGLAYFRPAAIIPLDPSQRLLGSDAL